MPHREKIRWKNAGDNAVLTVITISPNLTAPGDAQHETKGSVNRQRHRHFMMVRFRKRSVSGGSYKDMNSFSDEDGQASISYEAKLAATHKLFSSLLKHQGGGKSCLHFYDENPALMTALLDRAQQLDEMKESSSIRKELLLATDVESGYNPLHWGVYRGSLASVLFFLRHALSNTSPRLTQRPMDLLQNNTNTTSLLEAMVTAKDREGYTAAELLASRQRFELLACRLSLPRPRIQTRAEQRRRTSFDLDDGPGNEQNEFDVLSRSLHHMQRRYNEEKLIKGGTTQYGCEVLTFGQAHHCALGVGSTSDVTSQQVRPQRVKCFSQSQRGRQAGAVAVAAAAHHTLIATANGEVYACGLGRGGRLGLGDQITHSPTPSRIRGGGMSQRKVVGIAATENHSIAVTSCGYVYTWGSNRFGQLSEDGTSRSTPRRVEDLKNSFCVAVAAGARHSVALSRQGEVYVWGDNTAGQLGISRRNGAQKVQRVESLWNSTPPKLAIAVDASEQATLVLTIPSGSGLPVNSVYAWGHGNNVPSRVVFDSSKSSRAVNPIAIACARYHNVAVSSDGLVYTWGLHAETLGVQQKSKKCPVSSMISSPQIVKGMLPENGGGLAVAVSASENHTAVLTDTGAMFTWGASNSKNVMGHIGVRWQPDPKRVPGVNRAVAVAAAKEHTVFLMGASFPPLPDLPEISHGVNSLEDFAVRRIADFIDLFNAVPLLTVAERTDSARLIDYCAEFCRRNLDGVIAVAQKSVLDAYLNEQLSASTLEINHSERDCLHHPLVDDLVFAGSKLSPLNTITTLCAKEDWIDACEKLSRSEKLRLFLQSIGNQQPCFTIARRRTRSLSNVAEDSHTDGTPCSDRCLELTTGMDLSTLELAEKKQILIVKELRGVKKRLNQIARLEENGASPLSVEQQEKVARRPQLEADLRAFEPALAKTESKIKQFSDKALKTPGPEEETTGDKGTGDEGEVKSLKCSLCGITCPDNGSYTMHMNGRKHRNRVAQAKEEEEAKVAADMAKNCNKMMQSQLSSPKTTEKAWAKPTKRTPKLPCRLRPPPHSTPDTLVESQCRGTITDKPTLKEIMEEEASRQPTPKTLSKILATPRGAKTVKSSVMTSAWPLKLPEDAAPALKSPPWASPSAKVATPPFVRSPASTTKTSNNERDLGSFSLADYMDKPSTEMSSSPKPSAAPWDCPSATASSSHSVKKSSVSFTEIQQEELASKDTEIETFQTASGETNKWFIQRRERTGSLREIQDRTTKEREEQLLIEEQFRIEKLIAEENRRAKEEANKQRKNKQNKRKKNPAGEKKKAPGSDREKAKPEQKFERKKKPAGEKKKAPGNTGEKANSERVEKGNTPDEKSA